MSGLSKRPSVLVIDDDVDVRHCLRLLFEFDNFEVTEASSGPEAVACVLQADPEFIVLDYMMSGPTGDKVAPVLRSLAPDARIVAFSAMLEEKPYWADAFLNKDHLANVSVLLTTLLPAEVVV